MKKFFLLIFVITVLAVDIYFIKLIFFKNSFNQEEVKKEITQEINREKPKTQTKPSEENVLSIKSSQISKKQETQKTSAEEKMQKEYPQEENSLKIKKEPAMKAEKNIDIPEGYMIARVFVNLRKEPDTNSDVVTVIRKGDMVKIIGKKANHWKRVLYSFENRVYEGWVDDRFFVFKESQESEQ